MEKLREAANGETKWERHHIEGGSWVDIPYCEDFPNCHPEDAKAAVYRLDFQKRMEVESLDITLQSEAFKKLPNLVSFAFESFYASEGSVDLVRVGFKVSTGGIPWCIHVFYTLLQALARADRKPKKILWLNEQRDGCDANLGFL